MVNPVVESTMMATSANLSEKAGTPVSAGGDIPVRHHRNIYCYVITSWSLFN